MIRLEKTRTAEISLIENWENMPDNCRFIIPNTNEQHIQFLNDPDKAHLKVITTNEAMVGYVLLAGLQNPHHNIEFRRIVISEKGSGFGRKVVQLVKSLCFEKKKAHRVWLDVFEDNIRARKLYQSEGFTEEGILRECYLWKQQYRSLVLMSMLENEYFGRKNN